MKERLPSVTERLMVRMKMRRDEVELLLLTWTRETKRRVVGRTATLVLLLRVVLEERGASTGMEGSLECSEEGEEEKKTW